MRRLSWSGWLLAGVMLLQNVGTGLASPAAINPLDGHLLQHTDGSFYVYHAGVKFAVQVVDLGDQVINAIPNATPGQWEVLFRGVGPQFQPLRPNLNPEPFPGHS